MTLHELTITIGSDLVTGSGEKARDAFWELYGNDASFLTQNLDDPRWTDLVRVEHLEQLKVLQCEEIRRLRTEAYAQEFDGLAAGVTWDGDDKEKAVAKRKEIKARHPWPGSYR